MLSQKLNAGLQAEHGLIHGLPSEKSIQYLQGSDVYVKNIENEQSMGTPENLAKSNMARDQLLQNQASIQSIPEFANVQRSMNEHPMGGGGDTTIEAASKGEHLASKNVEI